MDVLDALSRSRAPSATSRPATSRAPRSWPTSTAASPAAPPSRWRRSGRARRTSSPASPTPTSTARRWSRSPARRPRTSSTRRPTRSSTSSTCSRRSRSGTRASSGSRRSPRSSARRSGSRPSRSRARPTSSCPRTWPPRRPGGDEIGPLQPGKAYFPEPTDEAIAHAARLIAASQRPLVLAGNGVLRRGAAAELRAFARGLHVPVAVTFMGKGADRRPVAPLADGGRAPGARPRAVGLRPRRPRGLGRLRPRRVRAGALEPGRTKRIVHIDTQPAEVDAAYRPEVELIGDIDGTLRRLLAAVLPAGSVAATPGSGTRPARSSSTPTCGPRSSRTSRRRPRPTTAGRSSRSGRSPTCAARSARRTSW